MIVLNHKNNKKIYYLTFHCECSVLIFTFIRHNKIVIIKSLYSIQYWDNKIYRFTVLANSKPGIQNNIDTKLKRAIPRLWPKLVYKNWVTEFYSNLLNSHFICSNLFFFFKSVVIFKQVVRVFFLGKKVKL